MQIKQRSISIGDRHTLKIFCFKFIIFILYFLQVEKDAKLPSKICPGCNIQLEATKSFLDLIIEGQDKLRELLKVQHETLKRQEKQRQQLEEALKNVNPNSSVKTYAIHTDETGEKFLIQSEAECAILAFEKRVLNLEFSVISDGPLFPPDHELSIRMEGKPRRKRGRPPKPASSDLPEQVPKTEATEPGKEHEEEEEEELDSEGRRKRKIKVPARFLEAVQVLTTKLLLLLCF